MPLQSHEANPNPTPEMQSAIESVREAHKSFRDMLSALCPASRELSLAFTRLEEAAMWANKAIGSAHFNLAESKAKE